jgi:glycogen(starch) synthase
VRVWHMSWEYPPVVFGGLGKHVHALAEAQARAGHEVTVITLRQDPRPGTHSSPAPQSEVVNGVRVERIDLPDASPIFGLENILPWVNAMQDAMGTRAHSLYANLHEPPEILHAHDWLVAQVTMDLSESFGVPAVATIHATERGRHQGWLPTSLSHAIDGVERSLVHGVQHVVTCSQFMADEVATSLALDSSHITVIPNGSHLSDRVLPPHDAAIIRQEMGIAAHPLLVFCGRLEWEKGAHTLIEALPEIRQQFPGTEIVIAGLGSQEQSWRQLATDANVDAHVHFTGWLPEETLHALITAADVLVIPSLYEPFGLVALEGAALGTPLVVARTGGLCEFVEDGVTGLCFTPGDSIELANAIHDVLANSELANFLATNARTKLSNEYDWQAVATKTSDVYSFVTQGITSSEIR